MRSMLAMTTSLCSKSSHIIYKISMRNYLISLVDLFGSNLFKLHLKNYCKWMMCPSLLVTSEAREKQDGLGNGCEEQNGHAVAWRRQPTLILFHDRIWNMFQNCCLSALMDWTRETKSGLWTKMMLTCTLERSILYAFYPYGAHAYTMHDPHLEGHDIKSQYSIS